MDREPSEEGRFLRSIASTPLFESPNSHNNKANGRKKGYHEANADLCIVAPNIHDMT